MDNSQTPANAYGGVLANIPREDIVERLRRSRDVYDHNGMWLGFDTGGIIPERLDAADEIERLRRVAIEAHKLAFGDTVTDGPAEEWDALEDALHALFEHDGAPWLLQAADEVEKTQ